MKRCPQCNRVESDEALVFCRVDGTSLVTDSGSVSGDDATVRFGSPPMATEAGTSVLPHHATDAGVGRPTGSTTVLDRQQTSAGTRELGQSKRTRVVVLAGAAVFIALIAVSFLYFSRKSNTIQSLAVLPFAKASGNSDVEYLSDGITESLINSLSQLPNFSVKARSTVFHYKGKDISPQQVGSELSVQAVLNGRVVQRGEQLTLSLELVNARTGDQIWGEQYNRKTTDLTSLQSEIARDVSNKIRTKLSGAEKQRVTKSYTANSEAYQLYLKGRFYWNKRTVDDLNRAIPNFQQAIDKDPNYALAYSGLADSYALLAVFGVVPPKDLMPQARAAATKSLALDDSLAEAHASLGEIMAYYDWDFSGAEREFRRAIDLNPNYATAHQWLAEEISVLRGHEEALAEIRRALELDPLSLIINRVYGDTLLNARRYDEAIAQYRKTIEMDPNFPTTHNGLGHAYEAKGMYDQAVAEYLAFAGPNVSPAERLARQEAYTRSGWKAFLQIGVSNLLERSKKGYVRSFTIASFYARLGQKDEAFAWLEKAYQDRDYQMTELNVRPELDSLRSDPRFAELVKRVGLPP